MGDRPRAWLSALFHERTDNGVPGPPRGKKRRLHRKRGSRLSVAGQERAKTLARVLEHADITGIYVSDRKRTQQTAQPLADRLKITPTVLSKAEMDSLPEKLKSATGNILIVGHSDTLPELMQALGVPKIAIANDEYDNLFIVTLSEKPRSIRLHYP